MERTVSKISNPRDPDFTNDYNADPELFPPIISTRCVTEELKPYWLSLDNIKNPYNGVYASFRFIKIPPPPPPKEFAFRVGVSGGILGFI